MCLCVETYRTQGVKTQGGRQRENSSEETEVVSRLPLSKTELRWNGERHSVSQRPAPVARDTKSHSVVLNKDFAQV